MIQGMESLCQHTWEGPTPAAGWELGSARARNSSGWEGTSKLSLFLHKWAEEPQMDGAGAANGVSAKPACASPPSCEAKIIHSTAPGCWKWQEMLSCA